MINLYKIKINMINKLFRVDCDIGIFKNIISFLIIAFFFFKYD